MPFIACAYAVLNSLCSFLWPKFRVCVFSIGYLFFSVCIICCWFCVCIRKQTIKQINKSTNFSIKQFPKVRAAHVSPTAIHTLKHKLNRLMPLRFFHLKTSDRFFLVHFDDVICHQIDFKHSFSYTHIQCSHGLSVEFFWKFQKKPLFTH